MSRRADRLAAWALAAAGGVALPGCDLEFVALDPPEAHGALSVVSLHTDSLTLRVHLELNSWIDPGNPEPVLLDGVAVPVVEASGARHRFRVERRIGPAAFGGLPPVLVVPYPGGDPRLLEGVGLSTPLPVLLREGAGRHVCAGAGGLALQHALLGPTQREELRWTLFLRNMDGDSQRSVRFDGEGELPDPLTVPAETVAFLGEGTVASLQVAFWFSPWGPGAPVDAVFQGATEWTVVTDPEDPRCG